MKKLFAVAATILAFNSVQAQGVTTAPGQDGNQPDISFETTTHDFGTIPEGPEATYVFKFKNTGTAPLILSNVQASCGCTTPKWSQEPVLPGQTGEVTAVYNTNNRLGTFSKNITITSNAKSGVVYLTILGTVVKAEEYKPNKVEPAPAPAPKVEAKPAAKPAKPAKKAKKKATEKPAPTKGS
jgi:hypothetical protein